MYSSSLRSPMLIPLALPVEDHAAIDAVNKSLPILSHQVDNFIAALNLFIFSKQEVERLSAERRARFDMSRDPEQTVRAWSFIAFREGAMCIFHIKMTMNGITNSLHESPSLKALVNSSVLRDTKKKFIRDFPNWESVRHAVAHAGEMTANSRKIKDNQTKKTFDQPLIKIGTGILVSNISIGDQYYTGKSGGEIGGYALNETSLGCLQSAVAAFYAEFQKAADHMRSLITPEMVQNARRDAE